MHTDKRFWMCSQNTTDKLRLPDRLDTTSFVRIFFGISEEFFKNFGHYLKQPKKFIDFGTMEHGFLLETRDVV